MRLEVGKTFAVWSVVICRPSYSPGYAVVQLVEGTSRKVAGSIPEGVIGIFH